ADGAEPGQPVDSTVVSRIDDVRIKESSGLAVSTKHQDLAYTINDSGNAAMVFAIRISTGDVVGTTTVRDPNWNWLDTEALALRDGTLWVADTGDNFGQRTDAAIYALDEPGPGKHTAVPRRYAVTYEDGPQNVEAIAVPPKSGRILLLSKMSAGGLVHRLPAKLRENGANVATPTARETPGFTTDATYTANGRQVLVRNYAVAQVRDAESWDLIRTDVLPAQNLGETIALEPSERSYLIGSEGLNSTLLRIAFHTDSATPSPTKAPDAPSAGDQQKVGTAVSFGTVGLVGGLIALVVIGIMIARRRSHPS
ncbi:MAG: esterase-like activity of phytase family protein, partial [Aeromicrobium sp.]